MTKIISVMTAGLFAAGAMFADDECGEHVERCKASLASLNLEDGPQKRMLNRALHDYRASNCTEAMEAKVMGVARDMLTPEQYEKFEAVWDKSRLQIAR
jgi:hypothetical protein